MSTCSAATTSVPVERFFDLVVVGSGPAALALVSRLYEERPATLYTEDESRHLAWLRKSSRSFLRTAKSGASSDRYIKGVKSATIVTSNEPTATPVRILVIDRVGGWMGSWERLFRAFDIPHLRSPLFFHPSPFDLDALLAYANRTSQNSVGVPISERGMGDGLKAAPGTRAARPRPPAAQPDLVEISGCVGNEVSKHKKKKSQGRHALAMGPAVNERERKDYFAPSTQLFHRFVQEDVVGRYKLGGTFSTLDTAFSRSDDADFHTSEWQPIHLVKAEAAALDWTQLHVEGWGRLDGFRVDLASPGSQTVMVGAKAVVCAVGTGDSPNIPPLFSAQSHSRAQADASDASDAYSQGSTTPSVQSSSSGPGWCHTSVLAVPGNIFPPQLMLDRERIGSPTTLVVLGGGLSSAQIVDMALRRGISRCVLVLRSHLKIKPFDVDLGWMGRYSNIQKMRFWQEDDRHARLQMIRDARNGGSITPLYAKLLRKHQEQGRLEILTCTEIRHAQWNPETQEWSLHLETSAAGERAHRRGSESSTSSARSSLEDAPVLTRLAASYIVAATGSAPSFTSLPFLSPFIKRNYSAAGLSEIEIGGLPALTDDLQLGQWPLFFVGGYSALQIGPGAFNLEGMRAAADRVAVRFDELRVTARSAQVPKKSSADPANGGGETVASNFSYFGFEALEVGVEA